MITTMTKLQEREIPAYINKWVRLASTPIDREVAFTRLKAIMPERLIIFTESFENTLNLIKFILSEAKVDRVEYSNQLGNQLRNQLYNQLGDQLYNQLGNQLGNQLYNQLRDQLRDQLRNQLGNQLRNQLYNQLGDQLYNQLYNQLGDQPIKWGYYVSYWWHEWLGLYDFAQYLGVEFDSEKLTEFNAILQNAPITVFVGNLVFVCEKPLVRWENGVISFDQKYAIEWKDGTGFYYLDGINFTEPVWKNIVSNKMKFADIMRIENADKRAVALKYNALAVLESGAKLIDKSKRGNELYLIENTKLNKFCDEKQMYFVKMTCPTGRTFVEGVEPGFAKANPKADTAQAWLCGIKPNVYRNLAIEG